MSDILEGSEKRTSRLAVFEHVSHKKKENSAIFDRRTNRMKRSPSPSDSQLVIDDDDETLLQPQKKRSKGVRLLEEPLKLHCGWQKCDKISEVYKDFIDHIAHHMNDVVIETEENIHCQWENCSFIVPTTQVLSQHACYHGYHTKLKSIGTNILNRNSLPQCAQAEITLIESGYGYRCEWEYCGIDFATIYEFLEHIRLHVNANPKYCKKGEFVECNWRGCSYKFSTQYKLADHLRSHTKERVIACPTCGNMFATKTKFYDHRKRQLPFEMQSYQCSQCSKLFPSERLLRDHMRSHVNHYKCSLCDMTCPKPSSLAKHIRYRHLDERPFKCNLCEHTCISRPNLESHLITHCSEKLLVCEVCDFRCRSLFGLDRHYQIVHGQGCTQYECHCCQRKFTRGNQLTRHLMENHDYHWPSGHSRFRYKEDADGIFRLLTVRYESLEVTQEMMRTEISLQPPQIPSMPKYNLKKEENSSDKAPSYVLMISESGEENVVCSTNNNILITIDDVDERGNIVSSETVESNEIVYVPENVRCLRPRKANNRSQ